MAWQFIDNDFEKHDNNYTPIKYPLMIINQASEVSELKMFLGAEARL